MSSRSVTTAPVISKYTALHYKKEILAGKTRRGLLLSEDDLAKRRIDLERYEASIHRPQHATRLRKFLTEQEGRMKTHVTEEANRVVNQLETSMRPVLAMVRGEVMLEEGASLQEEKAACNVAMAVLVNRKRAIVAAQKEEKAVAKAAARASSSKRTRKTVDPPAIQDIPVEEEEQPSSSSAAAAPATPGTQATPTTTDKDQKTRERFMQLLIKSLPKVNYDDFNSDTEDNVIKLIDDDGLHHEGWSRGLNGLEVVDVLPYSFCNSARKILMTRGREPCIVRVMDRRAKQQFDLLISARQLRNDFPSAHEAIKRSQLPFARAIFEYEP